MSTLCLMEMNKLQQLEQAEQLQAEQQNQSQRFSQRSLELQISDMGLEVDEKIASLSRRVSKLEAKKASRSDDDPLGLQSLIEPLIIMAVVFIGLELFKYYMEARNASKAGV
jgi:hypothetical protein